MEEVNQEVNVAFKCTYNDGGEGRYVGFCGTCSDNAIAWNLRQGRVWCNQEECACAEYYDAGFEGDRPEDPCYESTLFRDWEFGIGVYHTGPKAGDAMVMRRAGIGDLAIFTTRFPGDQEADRKIVGLFRIGKVYGDNGSTWVRAEKGTGIRLPLDIAKNLYFWDYYANPSSSLVSWGSGLFRYLTDEQTLQILRDVYHVTRDENTRSTTRRLLPDGSERAWFAVPPPSGARIGRGEKPIAQRAAYQKKYGSAGEGEDHKRLKGWVASRPEFLGLRGVIRTEVESHIFPSQDTPDIVFVYDEGVAVVEIETNYPMPGAFQALKYRALMCAERDLDLESPLVKACLVAWAMPDDVKQFCARYGIQTRVKRL